jgi:hypothetical protein
MENYVGDFAEDSTVFLTWWTRVNGVPTDPSTAFETADIVIYKDGGLGQKTAVDGLTIDPTYDGVTGYHSLLIDTSNNTNDAGFWVTGSDYTVIISPDETVGGLAVGATIGSFSIENRFMRGTDSAALASNYTSARAGYLDNINGHTAQTGDTYALANGLSGFLAIDADVEQILGDTGELQADWANAGRLDAILDIIAADTTTDIPALIAAAQLNLDTITGIDGATLATAQALYAPSKAGDSMDVLSISGDATAADNLEATFDGTGYFDDNAPATQAAVGSIAVTGSADKVGANAFVITAGSEVNTYTSTAALDGTNHELSDDGDALDVLYKFDIGINGTPTKVTFTGIFQGNNDDFLIYANKGTTGTPTWEQVGTINGTSSSSNSVHAFDMLSGQVVSDVVGEIQIRISNTGLTTSSFDVDQVTVSRAVNSISIGYDDGAVWIDTVRGTAGTTVGTHGTVAVPVDSYANAIIIAGNIGYGIYHFHLINDSAIEFTQDMSDWHMTGDEYAVALGGQLCDKTSIHGAKQGVTGTFTGDIHLLEGKIGTAGITGPQGRIGRLPIVGPIVCDAAAGSFFIHNCWSSTTLCALDFGAAIAGKTNWLMDFWGVIEIRNMLAGDVLYISSGGSRITFASSCTGGTVNMTGTMEIINNGSGMTFNDQAVMNTTELDAILIDTAEIGTAGAGLTNIGTIATVTDVTNEVTANVAKINTVTITGNGSTLPFDV